MVAAKKAVARPMTATTLSATGDHVNACGDHGGGMDQGADGGGTSHRVREPDIERDLRGFAAGADQKEQSDRGDPAWRGFDGQRFRLREDLAEIERAEMDRDEEDGERESEVADAVHDERFVAGVGGELFGEIEADQQVAAQAYSFPSYEQPQEVLGQHQSQHEKHEQIQIGEEAGISVLMRHVADRIYMDEGADAGDDQEHDGAEAVDGEIDTDVEGARLDPSEIVLDVSFFEAAGEGSDVHEGYEHLDEGHQNGENSNGRNDAVR
jgi:hypothetical protein